MQVVSGLMFGGGQRVALDLLKQLRVDDGINGTLVLLGCRAESLRAQAASVVDYDGRYNRPGVMLRAARDLRRVLTQTVPDIIHTHGWDADVIGSMARRGSHARHVVHLHVTADWLRSGRITHRFRRGLTRWCLKRPGTRIIAVSNAVSLHWSRHLPWPAETIYTIRNGIDTASFSPVVPGSDAKKRDGVVIGVAARLTPMKGLDHLLRAFHRLAPRSARLRLRIAGSGVLKEDLVRLADALGIRRDVEFMGLVDDMPSFYRAIDVFVLPSVSTEGLPLSVLEAMASGLPVIATTIGGTPEAITDGVDGLLVPPGDEPALAAAIMRVCSDDRLRFSLGARARQRAVADFSIGRVGREISAMYRASAD